MQYVISRTHQLLNISRHTMQVSVLELAPEDALQRRLLEKKWIKRFRTSPAHSVINRDDGVDALTLEKSP